jgi:hypothetical protein
VALIDGRQRGLNGLAMSESELTKLWLKHGYAELAESEKIRAGHGAQGEPATVPHDAPETVEPVQIDRPPGDHSARPNVPRDNKVERGEMATPRSASPERRHSLRDMAHRLTGKRSRKP